MCFNKKKLQVTSDIFGVLSCRAGNIGALLLISLYPWDLQVPLALDFQLPASQGRLVPEQVQLLLILLVLEGDQGLHHY